MNITLASNLNIRELNELYIKLHPVESIGSKSPISNVTLSTIKSYPLIIKSEGKVVGFLLLLVISYWDYKYASIEELFIDKPYRRKGFAKNLILEAIKISKNDYAQTITVGTDKINLPAISLYNKLGFIDDTEGFFLLKL